MMKATKVKKKSLRKLPESNPLFQPDQRNPRRTKTKKKMDSKKLEDKMTTRKNFSLETFLSQPPKTAWPQLSVNTAPLLILNYHKTLKDNLKDSLSLSLQPTKRHKLPLLLTMVKTLKAEV